MEKCANPPPRTHRRYVNDFYTEEKIPLLFFRNIYQNTLFSKTTTRVGLQVRNLARNEIFTLSVNRIKFPVEIKLLYQKFWKIIVQIQSEINTGFYVRNIRSQQGAINTPQKDAFYTRIHEQHAQLLRLLAAAGKDRPVADNKPCSYSNKFFYCLPLFCVLDALQNSNKTHAFNN